MKEQYIYTTDIDMASSLFTLGVGFRQNEPITRTKTQDPRDPQKVRTHDTFYFCPEASTPDFGVVSTAELYRQLINPTAALGAKNERLAFIIDYLRAKDYNRRTILRAVFEKVTPTIAQRIDGRLLLTPANASPAALLSVSKMLKGVGNV